MRGQLMIGLCLAASTAWGVEAQGTAEARAAKAQTLAAGQAAWTAAQLQRPAPEPAPGRKQQGLSLGTPGAPLPGAGLPGKAERLAAWRELDPAEAYRLFKDCGVEMPRELALRFNSSLEVRPWSEELRQAGGSPGTALLIADTNIGAVYTDHGNTQLLSNYFGGVDHLNYAGCPETWGFLANDGWYTFHLDRPTLVTVSTVNPTYYYDTMLGILDASLEQIAGNDDGMTGDYLAQSRVSCCLDPGTYFVVVDGYSYAAGQYDLTVDFQACAAPAQPTRGYDPASGYSWLNSLDGDGPEYQWFDIIPYGTAITLGDDDYTAAPIALGFDFPFFGTTHNQIHVGSNGLLGFNPASLATYYNTSLPNNGLGNPAGLICPFWDDLNPALGGTIHYLADMGNRRFFVQYTGVQRFGGSAPLSFQVVLDSGGEILVQYLDVDETAVNSATVGLENDDSTQGLTMNVNGVGGVIADNSCVRFLAPHATQGVDAFGYRWENGHADGGPLTAWTEISGGTPLALTGDDQSLTLALPFAFPFYGNAYTSVDVTSNGFLSFNIGEYPSFVPAALPNGFEPNNAIYPYWTDLYLPAGGAVFAQYDAGLNRMLIQWNEVPQILTYSLTVTFQVALYADGRIEMNYRDMPEVYCTSGVVGLENVDGSVALPIRNFTAGSVMEDNLSIRILPPAPRPTRGEGSGYAWINSLDPQGPDPVWRDISALGVNLGLVQDDQTVDVTLPFAFPFCGMSQTAMQVCSNGWLGFNHDLPFYFNQPLPSYDGPHNAIFAFWDDLYFYPQGVVYYLNEATLGRVIVQWDHVMGLDGVSGPYTFQLQLYSNGEIYLCYADLGNQAVSSATVGLQNPVGSHAMQVNYNGAGGLLANGLSYLFYPLPRTIPAIHDLRITPMNFSEGFATVHIDFTPITTDNHGNPLDVDHYLLLAVQQNPYDFSAPYSEVLPSSFVGPGGELYFNALGWLTSAYLRLVAVDSLGLLLEDGQDLPWTRESEIPGTRGHVLTGSPTR